MSEEIKTPEVPNENLPAFVKAAPELLPVWDWWVKEGKSTLAMLLVVAIAVMSLYTWKNYQKRNAAAASPTTMPTNIDSPRYFPVVRNESPLPASKNLKDEIDSRSSIRQKSNTMPRATLRTTCSPARTLRTTSEKSIAEPGAWPVTMPLCSTTGWLIHGQSSSSWQVG